MLVAFILPVTTIDPDWNKEPVNTIVSTLDENTVPVPPNKLVEPVTVKDPLITVDPVIVVFVFTTNPAVGLIEAVTLPLAIWDKLTGAFYCVIK